MAKTKTLTLYLTSWQKRMVQDFMPSAASGGRTVRGITRMTIKQVVGDCVRSYKIPAIGLSEKEWIIYLTDEQMAMVGDFLGAKTPLSSINVSQDFVDKGAVAFH